MVPNIIDPQAVDAQNVCPGYNVSHVDCQEYGINATLSLAGSPCNTYGDDIHELLLRVEHQAGHLHVEIEPTCIGPQNQSWFVSPESQLCKSSLEPCTASELEFVWGDRLSFWFKVLRKTNGEVLFDTARSVLVFENQFVKLKTAFPPGYNLYDLGQTVHTLRLGNDLTRTMWNGDGLDAVYRNLYGTHPVYYETRYKGGEALSHAVYYRNAHAHEVLLRPEGLTWRTLGGNVDLYVYTGPTMARAAQSYQQTVGLPAMQQYRTFGYHHARGIFTAWADLEVNLANLERFGIPLEMQWNDIVEMGRFQGFSNEL